jgi:signal transduction histidine kinase
MKLGRLFWKFFFLFWLAQVLTSVGVGVSIWVLRPESSNAAQISPSAPIWREPGTPPRPPRPPRAGPMPHAQHGWAFMRPLRSPWIPLLAGAVVSLLFAAWLAWYFSRPIRNLSVAFDAVAKGRLDTRIGNAMGERRDELVDLGSDFDRMAERLQRLVEGQQRLLHDVSHELRSPLARLQAAADLLRQQPDRAAELVDRIERDAGRMDRLVGELLTLARLDAGTAGRMDERVDATELLSSIAEDARFEAAPRQCLVELDMPETLTLHGNGELLHSAVENILRNALRHSPAGGRVNITARRMERTIRIDICDQGPGVPESELASIFEPFVRSQSAAPFSGYGLGLAITRRIVQAHGGNVQADNRPEGGLCVCLRLPAPPSPAATA